MKKIAAIFSFCVFCALHASAWNSEGHQLIAALTRKCVDQYVVDSVEYYLGDMKFEEAAEWMDKVAGEKEFEYMKPWHVTFFPKDKTYVKTKEKNSVNTLENCITLLKTKFAGDKDRKTKMRLQLLVLFHLIGDIHEPLNCGYTSDHGGADVKVMLDGKPTTLRNVWENEMLTKANITLESCLKVASQMSPAEIKHLQNDDPVQWLNDTRTLLPAVYGFKNKEITQNYFDKNKVVAEKQLVHSGVSLAYVLFHLFRPR